MYHRWCRVILNTQDNTLRKGNEYTDVHFWDLDGVVVIW